jgi:hypothetical protein
MLSTKRRTIPTFLSTLACTRFTMQLSRCA